MSDFTPNKRPDAPRPDISMMEATANAYLFIKDHYHTLLKWAVIPMIINFFTYIVVDWQSDDSELFTAFLWGLPATAAFAWYAFVQTRLQVMGEYAGNLPLDDGYAEDRRDAMTASICLYILFQMAMAFLSLAMTDKLTVGDDQTQISPQQMIIVSAGLIIMFWMIKFGVLHLIAAVGGNIRDYLDRVRGMWFSFLLIGVGFVSTLPVLLVFMLAISLASVDPDSTENTARFAIYALGTVMSWAVATVLNASLVDALRQLYKGKKR